MLFIDTDSLVYEIKSEDVYEIFCKDKNLFDFSNYPKDSNFYDLIKTNEIGKIVHESKGKINDKFVGLKSKMYTINDVDGKENKTGKGVNSVVVESIKHKEYLDVLSNKNVLRHVMKRIQRKLHKIGTYDVSKILLPCFDNKRCILDDGINSLAYFHKDTRDQ